MTTKRSVKSIKGYRNYMWFTDRDGVITNDPDDTVHEWSNPMDAVRYGLAGTMRKGQWTARDPGGVKPYFDNLPA